MSTEHTELVAHEPQPLALSNQNPIAPMIEAITKSGVTGDNMAVLERMVALYERQESRNAEKAFAAAFVALQSDMPVIVASSIIPNRGKYERFEDVMRQVGPLLTKHGFSVSFAMDFRDNRIVQTCHLKHIAGHSQSNSFAVRAGGKADSDTQADCKAATTAKRNALLNALNIVIRQDVFMGENDATIDGEFISAEKVQYLREQVSETGSDERRFLALAGVQKFEEITTGSYDVLVRALAAKGRKQ